MKKILLFMLLMPMVLFGQEKNNENKTQILAPFDKQQLGLIISYWHEPAVKPGLVLGLDWEFLNKKGHGIAITFPQFQLFHFPYNYVALSFYANVSYRFIHPKNGFYTSLTMGVGLNTQWKTVPVYNIDGFQIKDPGFTRMFAVAQWDLGYDFELKYKAPVRFFVALGWNGTYPNNLNINSHMMFQLGVNVKLLDLTQIKKKSRGDK